MLTTHLFARARLEVPPFSYSSSVGGRRRQGVGAATRPREEEIVRKLRVLIVVTVLGFAWTVPVAAQAQVETAAWGWEALAERLAGWAEDVGSMVAGAKTHAPPPEEDGGSGVVVLDGGGDATENPDNGETYPGLDPNG